MVCDLYGCHCQAVNSFSQLVLNDPAVSNWHLLIYSIIYDPDDPSGVKPLIYAEDRSSNGTYWNRAFIGKRNRGVLLSDGDELRISPRITLSFQTDLQYDKGGTDEVQQSEVKVGIITFVLTSYLISVVLPRPVPTNAS